MLKNTFNSMGVVSDGGSMVQFDISAHRPDDFRGWYHGHLLSRNTFRGSIENTSGSANAVRIGTAPKNVRDEHVPAT